MDILQVALVFLILLLSILLTILGLQVFFILKDLRRSLDKLDAVLGDAKYVAKSIEKPIRAAAEVVEAIETGVKAVKAVATRSEKPSKRLFKRH